MARFGQLFLSLLVAHLSGLASRESSANIVMNKLPVREIYCEASKYALNALTRYIPGLRSDPNFHLSTDAHRDRVRIGVQKRHLRWSVDHWDNLVKSNFNTSHKTVVITHGYWATKLEKWINRTVEGLHAIRKVNVILVDWSFLSRQLSYPQAARDTPFIGNSIAKFMNELKNRVAKKFEASESDKWNRLYFIGHSLGAHVCGQAAHALKSDPFWVVERITGLDPAKPCFVNAKKLYKLDNSDAKYVDVIHSQIGSSNDQFSYGINEALGDVDFYVDGGAEQPRCLGSAISSICAHQQACEYYIDSLREAGDPSCTLYGYKWDGKRESALNTLNITEELTNRRRCEDCPQLGINSINSSTKGQFLVLTSSTKSNCSSHDAVQKVEKIIEELKPDAKYIEVIR